MLIGWLKPYLIPVLKALDVTWTSRGYSSSATLPTASVSTPARAPGWTAKAHDTDLLRSHLVPKVKAKACDVGEA